MKSLKVRLILFFISLVMAGTLISGYVIYSNYRKFVDQSLDDRLTAAVTIAQAAVDFTKVNALLEEGGNETPFYKESLRKLDEIREALGLEYIFNLTLTGPDEWTFVFDTADAHPEDFDDLSYQQVYEPYEGMLLALEKKGLHVAEDFYTDEWGTFKSSALPVYDDNGNLITVIGADLDASLVQSAKRRVLLIFLFSVAGTVGVTALVAVGLARSIVKPLEETTQSLEEIASGKGDLSKRLTKKENNEIGRMVDSYNNFQDSLNGMLLQIVKSAGALDSTGKRLSENMFEYASAVEEIVSNIASINRQVKNQSQSVDESSRAVSDIHHKIEKLGSVILAQSSSITESSAAIEEMTGNIAAVSKNMDSLSGFFRELQGFSDEGKVKIANVMDQVKNISQKSQALQEANSIIAGIAAQTNLLAMNAAIEAAHAGDSGRGFSVVADEIRKLAEQSAVQSKTIGVSLKEVLGSINSVVDSTSETEKTFEKVIGHVKLIGPLEMQVKEALVEQRTGSSQILEALSTMNQVTVDVTDGSRDIKESSDLLVNEIQTLNRITGEVTGSMGEIESGVRRIQTTTSSGEELVKENEESIQEVLNETNRFKLKRD